MYLHLRLVLAQNWCICGNHSPSSKNVNHAPYLPQCKVQVRGVVAGWRDIRAALRAVVLCVRSLLLWRERVL